MNKSDFGYSLWLPLYGIEIPDGIVENHDTANEIMMQFAFESEKDFMGIFREHMNFHVDNCLQAKWNWLVSNALEDPGIDNEYRIRLEEFLKGIDSRYGIEWDRVKTVYDCSIFVVSALMSREAFGIVDRVGIPEFLCNDKCRMVEVKNGND